MVQKHLNVLPPESEQSAHKSLITSIGRQLITDFHPAVKNVSLASQNLLRSFQSISHHFYAYTAALYALGYSSSNSEEVEVREQSKRLQRVTEVLKTVHSEQIEWMDYFTSMTLTVSQNSKTEKERLKALLNGFTMRERQLTKAIHRGKQMPDTLSSFYETELEAMRDQQVQRYRFFADKHLELLRRYREWMQFSLLFFEELNLDEKDELTNLDNWRRMGRTERQMDEFGGNDEGERETDNGNSNRMRDKPKQEETERAKNGERMAKKGEGMDKKRQPHEGAVNADGTRQEKGKSAMEEAQREAEAQRTVIAELEKKFTTEDGWSAGRRREFPAKLFRPTPIMPTTKYRHSVADGMLARNIRDSQVWKTVVKIGAKGRQAEGRRQRNTAREEKQPEHGEADAGALRHFYEDKPTGSDATQRLQRNGRIAVDEKEQNDNGQKDRIGQTELRKFHFDTALSLEQCHARGESQDSSGSNSLAKMHRNMSPKFGPLDYGRLIECTTPFNGQEDNQLSLMAGERVLLVKSGTRGWVLGKSTDGTRSGWFPAKYVKLVC